MILLAFLVVAALLVFIMVKRSSRGKNKKEQGKPPANVSIKGADRTIRIVEETYEPEVPEYQGDYAKAVFLNAYAKASPIKAQKDYQRYLLYECGIRDCRAYHKEMIDEGYLRALSVQEILSQKRVADLKPILSELGLPVSGKKDALCERLLSNASEEFLREKFPDQLYGISEKGTAFLQEHDGYVILHRHSWGISWREFDKKKQKRPKASAYDILYGILSRRIADTTSFGRNEYLSMYQLLVEENRRTDALMMLLRIIYIDVSGVEVTRTLQAFSPKEIQRLYSMDDLFGIAIMLAPGIIYDVAKYADVYDDSMVNRIYEWKLPLNVCEKSLFLELIHSLIDDHFDEDEFTEKLKKAFAKAIREKLK